MQTALSNDNAVTSWLLEKDSNNIQAKILAPEVENVDGESHQEEED